MRPEWPKIEVKGRERGWGSWVGPGQIAQSSAVTGSEGALWAPPAGFGVEPRPPKGFPLFSSLDQNGLC